jgi:hypothetical protein
MKFTVLLVAVSLIRNVLSEETTDEDLRRTEKVRLELWSRGAFDLDSSVNQMMISPMRMGPSSSVRRQVLQHKESLDCEMNGYCSPWNRFRGGAEELSHKEQTSQKIEELGVRFGLDFLEAIERNKKEHEEDCKASCEMYYCASPEAPLKSLEEVLGKATTLKSYSMGPVPPEDFAESFGYVSLMIVSSAADVSQASSDFLRFRFPLDVIKVTETAALFSATEAAEVVSGAEAEGVDKNEFKSGKYQLAGEYSTYAIWV